MSAGLSDAAGRSHFLPVFSIPLPFRPLSLLHNYLMEHVEHLPHPVPLPQSMPPSSTRLMSELHTKLGAAESMEAAPAETGSWLKTAAEISTGAEERDLPAVPTSCSYRTQLNKQRLLFLWHPAAQQTALTLHQPTAETSELRLTDLRQYKGLFQH